MSFGQKGGGGGMHPPQDHKGGTLDARKSSKCAIIGARCNSSLISTWFRLFSIRIRIIFFRLKVDFQPRKSSFFLMNNVTLGTFTSHDIN